MHTSFVSEDDNGIKIGDLSSQWKLSKHALVPRKSIDEHVSPITAVDVVMNQHACDGSIATTSENFGNRPDAEFYTSSISLKVVHGAVVCSTIVLQTRLFSTAAYKLIIYFDLCVKLL